MRMRMGMDSIGWLFPFFPHALTAFWRRRCNSPGPFRPTVREDISHDLAILATLWPIGKPLSQRLRHAPSRTLSRVKGVIHTTAGDCYIHMYIRTARGEFGAPARYSSKMHARAEAACCLSACYLLAKPRTNDDEVRMEALSNMPLLGRHVCTRLAIIYVRVCALLINYLQPCLCRQAAYRASYRLLGTRRTNRSGMSTYLL